MPAHPTPVPDLWQALSGKWSSSCTLLQHCRWIHGIEILGFIDQGSHAMHLFFPLPASLRLPHSVVPLGMGWEWHQ